MLYKLTGVHFNIFGGALLREVAAEVFEYGVRLYRDYGALIITRQLQTLFLSK